ncbi:MAG: VWA domain-containing protein [Nitrospiraceae bacterium]|nr:VWA domain-containing protein [Nitrospiraceae bacterium]
MTASSAHNTLIERLVPELGAEVAEALVAKMAGTAGTAQTMAAVRELLDELEDLSAKAVHAAIEALPELDRRAGLAHVVSWLDLGVALAESSGATALKYFKDSPLILGLLEPPGARTAVLEIGLELADRDANVTLEYLRVTPQILSVSSLGEVRPWLDIGIELTSVDVVVGLEYIRQIPRVASVLPIGDVRDWLAFGMKLVAPNTLGKPDYMAVMEFMRTSPTILEDIEHPGVRSKALSLGIVLAERSAQSGVTWLAESPRLLRALPSEEWQIKVLQYGALLAEQDAESTLSYLRRCTDVIGLIGDAPQALSRFENWFKAGMEVLAYSREGAQTYFAVESQKALASVEAAMSGVPLRHVARRVKLFVQGLCGTDVTIAALPDSPAASPARATVSADGRTISLPVLLRRYPTAEANERLYLVMAAHEAGHVEFGTYRLRLESLADVVQLVRQRYGRPTHATSDTLKALFQLYPHPRLAQDVWTVLEDARIDFLLQAEYPGLRRELAQLAAEAVVPRDPAHGLTVKELIVDCLLRLSTGETADSAMPHAVKEEVSILWTMCQPLFQTTATAEQSVRLAHDLYVRMEELLAPRADLIEADQATEESTELGVGPTASESMNDSYRPVTNWVYRGAMSPEFITRDREQVERTDEIETERDRMAGLQGGTNERTGSGQGTRGEQESMGREVAGGQSLSLVEELLALEVEPQPMPESTAHEARTVRYPEWDHTIQDYRVNWCLVAERPAETKSAESVEEILAAHRSAIRSLRRTFENLRPPAFRRVAGQADGDDLDIDAVVRRAAELRAGSEGDDRLYVRREKRQRDVAVAFLVDVSGSTSRRLDSGRRVIDVEKESLVLLCEALEAVGDQYGLYAYSGQGRGSVDFLTIKDFDDRLGPATALRLGGLAPRQQNRDGAAIRHASAKLRARDAIHRLLILVSDGRPLDGEYKDAYALEDTKTALREARQRGINPFCVTIDREADLYMRRMYGDVQFAVIDRVESLPSRLPRMYHRLTR